MGYSALQPREGNGHAGQQVVLLYRIQLLAVIAVDGHPQSLPAGML